MIKVEKVLIPVDGSDSFRNAAKYGTQLVNARNPKIYLLNVWEPVNMTIGGEMAEKLRQNAHDKSPRNGHCRVWEECVQQGRKGSRSKGMRGRKEGVKKTA